MIRAMIVDDEAPARQRLGRLLQKYSDVQVIGEASDGVMALERVAELQPEVVFLDIEMPELDGLSVAEALREGGPAVVFVTAYNEHALRAFDVAAVDYLVKPIADARLDAAIDRLRQHRNARLNQEGFARLIESLRASTPLRRLAVRCGSKFVVLDPEKITAVIARNHYAAIISEGRELLADDSLDVLAARLSSERFVRVHRSAVINIDCLKELEREGDRKYLAVLNDSAKTKVPVSRERLDELKARLGV